MAKLADIIKLQIETAKGNIEDGSMVLPAVIYNVKDEVKIVLVQGDVKEYLEEIIEKKDVDSYAVAVVMKMQEKGKAEKEALIIFAKDLKTKKLVILPYTKEKGKIKWGKPMEEKGFQTKYDIPLMEIGRKDMEGIDDPNRINLVARKGNVTALVMLEHRPWKDIKNAEEKLSKKISAIRKASKSPEGVKLYGANPMLVLDPTEEPPEKLKKLLKKEGIMLGMPGV